MIRSGIGYDIHKLENGLPLYIGGVKIKSPFGSVGHSDGDALIHSIVDSLLGAASLGDIGEYFPRENKNLKNVPSQIFLEKTKNLLSDNGFRISNLDSTIILQSPRLKEYISKIKINIAEMLKIDRTIVSVKAKTNDKLGLIGSSKGWAVIAISTINKHEESKNPI